MSTPDVSLGSWLARRAERTPDRDALWFEGESWTYGRLQREIDSVARQLGDLGVDRGDRVAFLGLNQPSFLIVMFAASRAGAVFVPLNFRLTGPEVEFQLHDCGARLVIADEMHRPLVGSIDLAGASVLAVDDLDTGGDPLAEPAELTADDVAVIMYTSGTTGRPKGAMLTHGNFWWNNLNALLNLDILADDRTLVVAPLFHIGGLNVTTLLTLQKGGLVVLHRAFDPGAALEALAEHRITTMFGVPAIFQFIAQHPAFAGTDLSSLRLMICGGAPCPEPLLKLWDQRGVPIQQGYGLTETAPMVTFLPPEYSLSKLGSSGITPMFCDVKLVDADGGMVSEPDARGEVCVRGPNVTPGYWNRPDATAAAIDPDGWFHTGDIAYLDAEGFLYIADRVKDMIISGGENVYPAEVESVLFDHPAIADIAVIGSLDEKWGETVTAVAVLVPDTTLTIDELREWAGERLARYKLPRRLEVVGALPRGGSGKVLKFELRESFA